MTKIDNHEMSLISNYLFVLHPVVDGTEWYILILIMKFIEKCY